MLSKLSSTRLNPPVNGKENLVPVVIGLTLMAFVILGLASYAAPDLFSASVSTLDRDVRLGLAQFTVFTFLSQFVFAAVLGYAAGAHAPGTVNALNPTGSLAFVGWFGFGFAGGLWLLSYAISCMLHMMHEDWQPHLSVLKAAQNDMQRVLPWIFTSVPFAAAIGILTGRFQKDVD